MPEWYGASRQDSKLRPLKDRSLVAGGAGLFRWKEAPGLYPSVRSFKGLPRIRLEHQALSGTEGLDIHQAVIPLRNLFEEVMLVELRPHVYLLLRPAQRLEVALHVLILGILGN